jgi:hypothetical protein
MNTTTGRVYACAVSPWSWGRRASGCAGLLALVLLAAVRPAWAAPTTIDVSSQPVVLIQHTQPIAITTWDRDQIVVDAGNQAPVVQRRPSRNRGTTATAPYSVPIPAASVLEPDGTIIDLGAEEFPVQIPAGTHETVRIQVPPSAANVTIPANTSVLSINGNSATHIQNYHGQLIAQQRAGPLMLTNVSGDAFVQNLRGQILIADSNFDRLRTRTALNNMIFQRCNVKQIEATSNRGSIVYNNGTFQPGLARFETVTGHVALGVNGGANIAVKGQPGRIYQNFNRPTQFYDRNGEANALVGGGGPLVNVFTQQGRVFLYNGSLMNQRALPRNWGEIRAPLERLRQRVEEQQRGGTAQQFRARSR